MPDCGIVRIAALVLAAGCASGGAATRSAAPTTADQVRVSTRENTGRDQIVYFADVHPSSDMISVAAPTAWTQLAPAYAALGLPVTTTDSAARLAGTANVTVLHKIGSHPVSEFLDCGTTAFGPARANTVRVVLTAFLESKP